jgi:hypothetical protein
MGKAKLISQTDRISQQPENWENRNDPDLVQAFPVDNKRWIFIKYCVDYYHAYFVPVLFKMRL